jgi:hypothetical protein
MRTIILYRLKIQVFEREVFSMKKAIMLGLVLIMLICLPACSVSFNPSVSGVSTVPTVTVGPLSSQINTPTPTPTIAPTITPAPSPSTFGETPDHAGSGDVLFDIYVSTALVDLNKDGTPEELTFTKGSSKSTLNIGGTDYTVNHSGLAQLFAVTDVDISDNILELAFTDKYSSDLADTEFPFTWLCWWNGTALIQMGGLMNMKFDGAWRSDFDPTDNLDAHGIVMCLTRTQNFTDIWYTGHYAPDGADRKLDEKLYSAKPLFHPEPVTTKSYILLLKNRTNTYFDFSYAVMWDYASGCGGYAWKPRDTSDGVVTFIPQAGEELSVAYVYGKQWFKLKASDGKSGWLRCKDMKVYGYWPVMGSDYTADNLFDGIVVAG